MSDQTKLVPMRTADVTPDTLLRMLLENVNPESGIYVIEVERHNDGRVTVAHSWSQLSIAERALVGHMVLRKLDIALDGNVT